MNVSETFISFLNELAIKNHLTIETKYENITQALNKNFRNTESKKDNCLQIGSYGRWTAINGVSDLDMLYIMPKNKWDEYNKKNGQTQLLDDTKKAILDRYPNTSVRKDRLVVSVNYTDFYVEVQPVFEQDDGSFKYPDTHYGGSWKPTKPREEIEEIKEINKLKNRNLRRLCKMIRAWKNHHGVNMGGLLIDTLAYNFLKSTDDYDSKSYHYYDYMCRDFFKFLSEEPKQERYAALGSGQHVRVKKDFRPAAKKAYELSLKAIDAQNDDSQNANNKWRSIFGTKFPKKATQPAQEARASRPYYRDTEEFIESKFPLNIRYNMEIDCHVSQNGFREKLLSKIIKDKSFLGIRKNLDFFISEIDVPPPYLIYWKVLNRGEKAILKDCIRGQITLDKEGGRKTESTSFSGEHVVECYAVKDDIVVARSRIKVPITV